MYQIIFVVGQIMGGNVDAAKLFMNGELPWHFVYGIFYKFYLQVF